VRVSMETIRVSYRFAKYQFCTMALLSIGLTTQAQETLSLASPDGNIQTKITLPIADTSWIKPDRLTFH